MKVLVFDPLWTSLLTEQNELSLKNSGAEVVVVTKEAPLTEYKELFSDTAPKILAINPDYVGWSLPADSFAQIQNLTCILTASTSFSWIDTDFASKHNIPVCNIRNFCTEAVADWAILMMFNILRKVPLLIKNEFPLNFASDYQTYQGMNIRGKKVGIIGLGNIGAAIAERCNGLGMEVSYWSKSKKETSFKQTSIETLFQDCDVIFPCMADSENTKGIINDDLIKMMKPSSSFISVVHKYYNHNMLLDMVEKGTLFGYAFEADPASFSNFKGNVWAAPAYAWCTDGSTRNSMDMFVVSIVNAVQGKYPNRVN